MCEFALNLKFEKRKEKVKNRKTNQQSEQEVAKFDIRMNKNEIQFKNVGHKH